MENLQDATAKICELKGTTLALETLIVAVARMLPCSVIPTLIGEFERLSEIGRSELLHASISEETIGAFELDVRRLSARVTGSPMPAAN